MDHMQIICTSLQTDNHASTSPLSFLQAGCPSCRPTSSVKALKANGTTMSKQGRQYIFLPSTALYHIYHMTHFHRSPFKWLFLRQTWVSHFPQFSCSTCSKENLSGAQVFYGWMFFTSPKQQCHWRTLKNAVHSPPHHNHFTALFLGPPGWAGARIEILDSVVQGRLTEAVHSVNRIAVFVVK